MNKKFAIFEKFLLKLLNGWVKIVLTLINAAVFISCPALGRHGDLREEIAAGKSFVLRNFFTTGMVFPFVLSFIII